MYLQDSDIEIALASLLKVASFASVANYWTDIVQKSHAAAYQDIFNALIRRGFTPAQIAAWDRGPEFENHIALFWCLVNGGGLQQYDPTYIKMLDRRPELRTVEVSNNGVWQSPGIAPPSGPGQAYAAAQERHNFGFGPLSIAGGRRWGENWSESNPDWEN